MTSPSVDHSESADAAPSLEPRLERLRALRSAWSVLAPSGISDKGIEISELGRALTDRLAGLQDRGDALCTTELAEIDVQLDAFEASMREVAGDVPISQLRSTLPAYLMSNRAGLLDLLDVVIGHDPSTFEIPNVRIGAIDYLITLLCTQDGLATGAIQNDPITLTPRVQALCQHAEETDGMRFADVEAEFFAASNMDAEDLREEIQLRTLRSRKTELGMAFFVPRILRAVVTYNAALLGRVTDEILSSGDWGSVGEGPDVDASHSHSAGSVFESQALQGVAQAVRRRAQGEQAEATAGDRIALALDFDYLEPGEQKALRGDQLGTDADPLGTAILVGLICRSLAVLSIELQAIGISPDDVSDRWVAELNDVFQEQINANISADAYKVACALSELKNKFLSAPLADQFRRAVAPKHVIPPVAATQIPPPAEKKKAEPPKKKENARDLVQHALDEARASGEAKSKRLNPNEVPWAQVVRGATLAVMLVIAAMLIFRSDGDLARWSGEELRVVSPYLSDGNRTQGGIGHAFVGTLDASWLALPAAARSEAAEELVFRLRELGMTQIMIYDDDDALRIQAVGSQPILTL